MFEKYICFFFFNYMEYTFSSIRTLVHAITEWISGITIDTCA